MRASTLFGIVLGLAAIFGAYFLEGGRFNSLFLLPPMLIVFGGTLAAGIAGSSLMMVARLPKLFMIALRPQDIDKKKIMDQIIGFTMIARKEGILSLEKKLPEIQYPHLKKMLQITIDSTDNEIFEEIIESDIYHLTQRHNENINLLMKLGGYAPTMGLIGTVMGITAALAGAGENPLDLIHNIATALIATLWGILSANLIWLPIGDKLRFLHEKEVDNINFILEGIRGLHQGETPTLIRQRMISAFPIEEQKKFNK